MNHPREDVAEAFVGLFSKVGSGSPFVTVSRVFQAPANVDASQEPALFIVEDDEIDDEAESFGAQRYELLYKLVIFGQMPDISSGSSPGAVLNPLIDAVDNSLYPAYGPGEKQTLGGLVQNCWIKGRALKVAGYLGQHVVAVIPISILTGL